MSDVLILKYGNMHMVCCAAGSVVSVRPISPRPDSFQSCFVLAQVHSLPDFYCCNAGYDNQDMEDDVVFDGGYQVPGSVYSRLFDYQKTGLLLQINRETAVNSWHGRCMHSGYNMCHQSAESTYSVYSRHCCSGNPGGKLIVQ